MPSMRLHHTARIASHRFVSSHFVLGAQPARRAVTAYATHITQVPGMMPAPASSAPQGVSPSAGGFIPSRAGTSRRVSSLNSVAPVPAGAAIFVEAHA